MGRREGGQNLGERRDEREGREVRSSAGGITMNACASDAALSVCDCVCDAPSAPPRSADRASGTSAFLAVTAAETSNRPGRGRGERFAE